MGDDAVTTPADPDIQPAEGQMICPVAACRGRRFFVYLISGVVEVVCAECGARAHDITQTQEVSLS
jgi:hypothetical protein